MSNPWRIALVVALVLFGVGGGMCALRTAKLVERQMEGHEVEAESPESPLADEKPGNRD